MEHRPRHPRVAGRGYLRGDPRGTVDGMEEFPVDLLLRAARRHADLSQRELAARAGVQRSVVSRIESGSRSPSVAVLVRLLRAAGCHLEVQTRFGVALRTIPTDRLTDGAGRRYPAHLDVYPTAERGWWGGIYAQIFDPTPEHSFDLSRGRRDWYRNGGIAGMRDTADRSGPT